MDGVIDSSVIPKLIVSGGVSSSVHMLAEVASDKLVKEYSCLTEPASRSGKGG